MLPRGYLPRSLSLLVLNTHTCDELIFDTYRFPIKNIEYSHQAIIIQSSPLSLDHLEMEIKFLGGFGR